MQQCCTPHGGAQAVVPAAGRTPGRAAGTPWYPYSRLSAAQSASAPRAASSSTWIPVPGAHPPSQMARNQGARHGGLAGMVTGLLALTQVDLQHFPLLFLPSTFLPAFSLPRGKTRPRCPRRSWTMRTCPVAGLRARSARGRPRRGRQPPACPSGASPAPLVATRAYMRPARVAPLVLGCAPSTRGARQRPRAEGE